MRAVAVVGVGMSRFGRFPDVPAHQHGVTATVEALKDAGLTWPDMQMVYCASAGIGMFNGSLIGHELGLTGVPLVNIENASASGSSAFREAYLAVAEGRVDIALAVGIGKMDRDMFSRRTTPTNRQRAMPQGPAASMFAMVARRRMELWGTDAKVFAQVAVKNHAHGALNPYAQFQKATTIEEVMGSRMIADPLHLMDCCPTGDGGAAAIVTTREIADRLSQHPVVSVAASTFVSQIHTEDPFAEWALTEAASKLAYEQAGVGPEDLDLVQVHDAFSCEEIEYYEALGLCPRGEGERLVVDGDTTIGGRVPFSTDGGLLARGHPLGPTGLAQVWETVTQLRGDAGGRQVEGAQVGLLQMIGAGTVCVIHVLKR